MAVPGPVSAEAKKAEDFRSIYVNGVQFTGTGDDVRLHFWTNEMVPESQSPVEARGPEVKLFARMHFVANFRVEVIMPFTVFEKFAEMIADQYASYRKAKEGGPTA